MRQFGGIILGIVIGLILGAHFFSRTRIQHEVYSPAAVSLQGKTLAKLETAAAQPQNFKTSSQTTAERALVTRSIDGDTIEVKLNGGEKFERVRYIGIDAPETVNFRKKNQCYGEEAARENKELVLGKEVLMRKDISERDKFGRLLRYVYVLESEGELFVNRELVARGDAVAKEYFPDIKFASLFLAAQNAARNNRLGLWKECVR